MKLIPIYHKGEPIPDVFAKVDDADYERAMQHRWRRLVSRQGRSYAYTSFPIIGGSATVFLHKWLMETKNEVDHVNNDSMDCQRGNMRECPTVFHNYWNRGKPERKNGKTLTSRYKGVCCIRGRWLAAIRCQGKRYRIGLFDTEEDAARAYDVKARELHGEFAWVNFPS